MRTSAVFGMLTVLAVLLGTPVLRADDDYKGLWKRQYEEQKKQLKKLEDARKRDIERWKEAEEDRLEAAEEHARRCARGSHRDRIDDQYDRLEDELEAAAEREEKALERWRESQEKQLRLQYKAARDARFNLYPAPPGPMPFGSYYRGEPHGLGSAGPLLHDPHQYYPGRRLPAPQPHSPGDRYRFDTSPVPVNPPVPQQIRPGPAFDHGPTEPYSYRPAPRNDGWGFRVGSLSFWFPGDND
ncbi:MAG: hypothetical protein KJZ87_11260 [Thermoguttaceae bacterium]|nr:hypothetical protein [Thermoguttaceae bacterium]